MRQEQPSRGWWAWSLEAGPSRQGGPYGGRRQGRGHCWTWRDGPCLPPVGPLHRFLGLQHPGGPEVSLSDLRLSLQGMSRAAVSVQGGMKQYLGAS